MKLMKVIGTWHLMKLADTIFVIPLRHVDIDEIETRKFGHRRAEGDNAL